jgi:hypothetical protein
VQSLWKSEWRFLKKVKIDRITIGSVYITPGHIPEGISQHTIEILATLFITAKIWN